MNPSRIVWLDGMKGLACFAVMWHHFVLSFLPLVYSDAISDGFCPNNLERESEQSPWLFWINGNFMVILFLFISGIVMNKKIVEIQDGSRLPEIIIKGYLRLMLPLAVMAVAVFVFMKCGWLENSIAGSLSHSL